MFAPILLARYTRMGSTRAVGAGGSSSARRERSAPSSRRRSALLRSNAASSAPLTMRTAHGNEASKGQHRSAKMQAFCRDWQRRVAVDGPLQKARGARGRRVAIDAYLVARCCLHAQPSTVNSMPRPEHHPATFTHHVDRRMGTPGRPRPRIRDSVPRCVEPPRHSMSSM